MAQQVPPLLYGAETIAEYLGINTRQLYHLHETKGLPSFKMGRRICARRSDLDAWLEAAAKGGRADG